MSRFHRQDGAGGRQVLRAHDVGRRAQIRADADPLEDGGQHDERFRVRGWERVGAFFDRRGARFLESGGQEGDMSGLVGRNLLQVVVEGGVKSGGSEVALGVVRQTLTVELVFQMLQSQRIVKDICIGNCWCSSSDVLQAVSTWTRLEIPIHHLVPYIFSPVVGWRSKCRSSQGCHCQESLHDVCVD